MKNPTVPTFTMKMTKRKLFLSGSSISLRQEQLVSLTISICLYWVILVYYTSRPLFQEWLPRWVVTTKVYSRILLLRNRCIITQKPKTIGTNSNFRALVKWIFKPQRETKTIITNKPFNSFSNLNSSTIWTKTKMLCLENTLKVINSTTKTT